MSDQDWYEWMTKHALIFAIDAEMVNSWRGAFEVRGYSPHELHDATLAIAAKNPPRYRNEHLAAIHGRITERRLERARFENRQSERYVEDCKRCSDSGTIMVPHLKSLRNGEWVHPFYEMGVFCLCRRGRIKFNALASACEQSEKTHKPRPMAIDEYERHNPQWEFQAQKKELEREENLRAEDAARKADDKFGPLRFDAAEILRRFVRQPGDEAE